MTMADEISSDLHRRGFGAGLDVDPAVHAPAPTTVEGRPEQVHHQLATKVVTDRQIRCQNVVNQPRPGHSQPRERVCGKMLANVASRPWEIVCPRCGMVNSSPTDGSLPSESPRSRSPGALEPPGAP